MHLEHQKAEKGGRGGASDQLKKLGARRLRLYYGSAEAAVEAIESAFSNTRDKPPYSDADALRQAASMASEILREFKRAGRFSPFDVV